MAEVLALLTGGGFTFEMRCLLAPLAGEARFTYLATEFSGTPGEDGLPAGPSHPIPRVASVTRPSKWRSVRGLAGTFAVARRVMARQRFDLVIAPGCSHAVPVLLAARVTGTPSLFLESITRVDRLSRTGEIVRRARLAGRFVVQWPALAARVPGAELGTVL